MAKSTAEENSERKRISIPKADESVLAWWDAQKDTGLSVRLLIRNEIERNGYTDTAYRPVAQLPRRGRPPGTGSDAEGTEGSEPTNTFGAESVASAPVAAPAPVLASVPAAPQPTRAARRVAQPAAQHVAEEGFSTIDDIMNG